MSVVRDVERIDDFEMVSYFDHDRFREKSEMMVRTATRFGALVEVYRNLPEGCLPHSESPFAFKPHLLDVARKRGAAKVLWVDSSIRFVGALDWIGEELMENGTLFVSDSDQPIARWCNEESLAYFGVERGELGEERSLLSGFVGLDFSCPAANRVLDCWLEAEAAGIFRGSWDDHRHDQTALSLIVRKEGLMTLSDKMVRLATWPDHAERVWSARVIVDRGNNCPVVRNLLETQEN